MKDQVLSITQMQHLKELCVDTSKASMYWSLPLPSDYKTKLNIVGINGNLEASEKYGHSIGAFTLQDMLEMIPSSLYVQKDGEVLTQSDSYDNKAYLTLIKQRVGYTCEYKDVRHDMIIIQEYGDTPVEAAYNILCWLAENKLLGKEEKK